MCCVKLEKIITVSLNQVPKEIVKINEEEVYKKRIEKKFFNTPEELNNY